MLMISEMLEQGNSPAFMDFVWEDADKVCVFCHDDSLSHLRKALSLTNDVAGEHFHFLSGKWSNSPYNTTDAILENFISGGAYIHAMSFKEKFFTYCDVAEGVEIFIIENSFYEILTRHLGPEAQYAQQVEKIRHIISLRSGVFRERWLSIGRIIDTGIFN